MSQGLGGGLIGGALIADAFEDHEQHEEQQAYDQGCMSLVNLSKSVVTI